MEVGRRVLFEDQPDMGAAVDVEMDAGDPAGLAGEERSWASARRLGCTRTRLPRATGTPLISDGVLVRPDAGFRLRIPPGQVLVSAAGKSCPSWPATGEPVSRSASGRRLRSP